MKFLKSLLASALLIAASFVAQPARAEQDTVCFPTTGTLSGLTLVTTLNAALKSLLSSNSGATEPTNDCSEVPIFGQWWIDDSATPAVLNVFDGTEWVPFGRVDETTHEWLPAIGGGANTIASASTVDLWSVDQSLVNISGTTTVTALATSAPVGSIKTVVFTGALTLTHNATSLILPGGASIPTAAGDTAIVVSLGGANVRVLAYIKASGLSITANSTFTSNFLLTGIISPSSLSSNQNDWAPTGIATASIIRVNLSADVNITGISAQSSGTLLVLQNISSNTFTLVDASASSSAANRFSLGADYLVGPSQTIQLRYDGTSSRWVAIGMARQMASQTQATTGTDNTTIMSPLRVLQSVQTGYRFIGTQTFSSSGTYTPTSGARYAIAWGVGAGAGGGGADAADVDSGNGGGGGGAGQMFYCEIDLTGFSPTTVTIGAAGTAGAGPGGGNGGDGGDTILVGYATADGGHGGEGVSGDATRGADGGAGGSTGNVSGCTSGFLITGQGGGFGTAYVYGAGFNEGGNGGAGGGTLFGGGAPGTNARGSAQSQAGVTASGFGAGGSGGAAADNTAGFAGGAGFKGFVFIQEFN